LSKVIRIERVEPRPGKADHAFRSPQGYIVADPEAPSQLRRLAQYRKFVPTLEEAAACVERGWYIRMGDDFLTSSLIKPDMVRIIRA
jgi:hypothetical protein